MDDNRIVELYLARDEAAIAETRRKYGSKLRKISYALIRDHAYAEECEYEAYYEAWKYTPYLIIGFLFMTLGSFLSMLLQHQAYLQQHF